mgnify:FL=1
MIARCDYKVARYRVIFRCMTRDPETFEVIDGGPSMKLMMHQHSFDVETRDGSPILSTMEPFEGELCGHEVEWLRGYPGKTFNFQWRFDVELL